MVNYEVSGDGYGDSYSDGSGYGEGCGSGYGDGYGDSSSDGSGYGEGCGSGYGDGNEYGDGYGHGDGNGYGDGSDSGAGSGYGARVGARVSANESNMANDYWDTYWVPARGHLVAVNAFCVYNTELRRRLIELMGYERFIQTASAHVISEDKFGRLLEVAGIPVRFVELTDRTPQADGTFRLYWEPVPQEMESPAQAVAWQWDFEFHNFAAMVKEGWVET